MIKKNKGLLIITSLAMLLPMLIGLLLWDRLPEQMPFHWNINGEVDAWSSKTMAVFGLPAILLVFHWVCVFACCMDPKNKEYPPVMLRIALWICPGIGLLLSGLVYPAAMGHSMSVEIIMPLIMGLLFIIIGNYLPKCKQSYTMGIKLPWTLNNEENWNKTHRFGGKVWVTGGVVIMATAIIGSFWIFIGLMVLMMILPTVYSYRHYRKYEK